ncbi:uncharacterized protein LOC122262985 [Penaeus japonicus]|uniref:uncharacterized protein LOC122262985 n=1 Tax=Penaeus japonicus TaxID=27405 RepID=UPI001C70CA04|nr:uncharacterized protein LOC122262985 [Penaeus japonicus]
MKDNASTSSASNPQIHRPNQQGKPHHERVSLKKSVQILRIGALNVGTMTVRGRAFADLMKNQRVDVMCVQEIRWSGDKARERIDSYKLEYGRANKEGKSGIGTILSREIKNLVMEVYRKNDRTIWIRLALDEFTANIFSVYAQQTSCTDDEKEHCG